MRLHGHIELDIIEKLFLLFTASLHFLLSNDRLNYPLSFDLSIKSDLSDETNDLLVRAVGGGVCKVSLVLI